MSAIYIAGPMTGIPYYNVHLFDAAARMLIKSFEFDDICNPADIDREIYGPDFFEKCPTGTEGAELGFDIRAALKEDLSWICDHATHMAMLPGWEKSSGANAEHALAKALGCKFIYLSLDEDGNLVGVL